MVMDPIVSHFEIFTCILLDQLFVIVKAHLLQLYIYIYIYIRNVCESVYTIKTNLS